MFNSMYSALIAVIWFIFLVYWAISAFNTKRTVYREKSLPRMIVALFMIIAVLFLVRSDLLGDFFQYRIFPGNDLWAIIGTILTAAGIFFAIWARVHIGRNWSGTVTLKENHELVQSGPYKIVRHPIYTGVILAFLGTAVAIGFVSALLATLICFIGFWIKLKQEERLMMKQFPKQYPQYKKKVKSLIPCVL